MGFIEFFLPRSEIEFAHFLADKIAQQFPVASENRLAKAGAQRRLEAILQTVVDDITKFQSERRLGWFRKARLGNAFRWRLAEHGYSEQFVEAMTKGLVYNMAIKHREP